MEIIIGLLLIALIVCVILLVGMFAFEKYAKYKKEKRIKELESLKTNDVIEIRHPYFDSKAIFKSLVDDCIHVIVMRNGVVDKWTVISSRCFVKKL